MLKQRLVAHRGDMTRYPENSLLAFQKAIELGFTQIELDVQLSNDHIPVVIHDENLLRTTGIDANVCQLSIADIKKFNLLYYSNSNLYIPSLKEAIEMLNEYENIHLYIEIKQESIDVFGLETVVNSVLKDTKLAKFNVIIISFSEDVINLIQMQDPERNVGWVIREYDEKHNKIAVDMKPDYIYCNVLKINSPSTLWNGNWKWALYDVKDPEEAMSLLNSGVDLIETGDIHGLSESEHFQ